MPGFRFCHWCDGKGCIGCDAERKKYAEKAMAKAPAWRDPDIRDVRNQALIDETRRLESLIGVTIGSQEEFNEIEAKARAEIEAAFQPALDAEYARQLPNGPQPALTVRAGNPADMALLGKTLGRESLNRVFADGVTREAVGEIHRLLDAARLTQAARQVFCDSNANPKDTPDA